jgi:hypothetical protein
VQGWTEDELTAYYPPGRWRVARTLADGKSRFRVPRSLRFFRKGRVLGG